MKYITDFIKDFNFELWNFVIAFIALALSIYAIYYSKKSDKAELDVSDTFFIQNNNDPYLASFTVYNISNTPVKIESISFYQTISKEMIEPITGYEPAQTYSQFSNNLAIPDFVSEFDREFVLEAPVILQPNSNITFRYFFNPIISATTIEILTNKRINRFKRNKLFPIIFKNTD